MQQPPLGHDTNADTSQRWLTLAQARTYLGVNETTLRQWADRGKVRAYRTPGGHRRFSEVDIRRLPGQDPAVQLRTADLEAEILAGIRRRLVRSKAAAFPWSDRLNEDGLEHTRVLGRLLLHLLASYLDRSRSRNHVLNEARTIGTQYGKQAARTGLPLQITLSAFLFFRESLDETLYRRILSKVAPGAAAYDLISHTDMFFDDVLLAVVQAWEEARQPADAEAAPAPPERG